MMQTHQNYAQALTLVSHPLCPYVQRAAIALHEKNIAYVRRDVDLTWKPAWFTQISPLGKTPVLVVGEAAIFESAVICEYLDDAYHPALHPSDALSRAKHRAWMVFGSTILDAIGGFYNAKDAATLTVKAHELAAKFAQVEPELTAGPYFSGEHFCLVDAVFAPIFRYFDVFDTVQDFRVFSQTPRVRAWRAALQQRPSVMQAVAGNYPNLLRAFLLKRESAISQLMRCA